MLNRALLVSIFTNRTERAPSKDTRMDDNLKNFIMSTLRTSTTW